ncbi:MAG: hypothetical protein H0W50_09370 [Parachlamydiaceae bacterium]|nr:hypothetical protein [Parachlamydiaceae bacterium]
MTSLSLGISIRILFCIAIAVGFVYGYIEKQNELTEVRLLIPAITKELKGLRESNVRLQFAINKFENPANLLELAKKPELSYLNFPNASDVSVIHKNSDK